MSWRKELSEKSYIAVNWIGTVHALQLKTTLQNCGARRLLGLSGARAGVLLTVKKTSAQYTVF
jgi:hypothetical protein